MATIAVQPHVIRWARERSGRPTDVLVKYFPKLELWERGKAHPTLRQLEDLAKKTFTPLGYFFLPEPPEDRLPIPVFRTLEDNPVARPSPDLLETVQAMQRRQGWMREYLIDRGQGRLAFVSSATLTDDVNAVAAHIRETLGFGYDWANKEATWEDALRALRTAVEGSGILIVFNGVVGNNTHRKLNVSEFRGFVLCDDYAPLVFVNSADVKAAQMFTVAHELAHLWIGKGAVFDLRELQPANDPAERFCNSVAAEFLVPKETLYSVWEEANSVEEPFGFLARYFKVSPLVAARRALDLNLINKVQFFDFYNAYLEDARRRTSARKGGGDFYINQDMRIGKRFAAAITRAAKEGRLLYRDAYQLTGLSGATFDRYVKSLGMGL